MTEVQKTIEQLAEEFLSAKKFADEAKALQDAAGQALVDRLGQKEEGSKSHKALGFKIEIKGVINRKCDFPLMETICAELKAADEQFYAPIKWKQELDEAGLRFYRDEQPGIYAKLAKAIEAKPGKTGVTVVRTE